MGHNPAKRMVAFFLSIILMLSLLPSPARAADISDISSLEQNEAQDEIGTEGPPSADYADGDTDLGSDETNSQTITPPDSMLPNNENDSLLQAQVGEELIDSETTPDEGSDLQTNKPVNNDYPESADTEQVRTIDDPVAVTGVSLNQTELMLTVGGEPATLTATVEPEDADDKTVTWSSSNEAIATVEDGVVTPVAMGETTITVTTSDGGFSASCDVKVWGFCGANTRWFISGTTLTISGTGDMDNYIKVNDRPWKTDAAKITNIVVKEGVTSIGDLAFNNFSKLTSITLPSTLRTIGKNALAGLTGLTSITLPAGITSIGSGAFGSKLKTINFLGTADEWFAIGYDYDPAKISVYDKDGNLIERDPYNGNCGANGDNVTWHYDPDTKILTISGTGEMKEYTKAALVPWYAHAPEIQSVVVGAGVTSISGYAFAGYTVLTNVQLAESVTTIGKNAFNADTGLTEIDLSHVSTIGDSAFLGCSGLKNATLTNAASIGAQAFANCSGLESVALGSETSAVTSMGIRAFQNCSSLSTVTFANVETISDYSFQGTALTTAELNRTVTIGMAAFSGLNTLTNVSFGESLSSIGGSAFSGTELTEVTIPGNVESIGNSAFSGCTNMTEATIAEGITELPQSLFNGNTGLKKVALPISLEKVGGYAFNGCGLEEVNYAGTTAQWKAVVVEDNNDPLVALMDSGSDPVTVTGVSLNQTELMLTVGGEPATLTATVEPEDADDKTVTWSSSNEAIATVEDGVVTPVAMGETTITVTTSDGGFSASCNVTVDTSTHEVDLTGFTFTLFDTYTQESGLFNYNNILLAFELSSDNHGILYAPVCSVFSRTNIRPGIRIDAPEGFEGEFTVSYIGWESEGKFSCLGEQSLTSKNGSASIKHYYNMMSASYRTLQYTDYFRLSFPDGSEITLDLHLFNELCGISIKPGTIGEPIGNDGAVSVASAGNAVYSTTLLRGTTYSISIWGGINGSQYIPGTEVYIDGQLKDDLPQSAYWYTPGEESEKDITIRLVNTDISNDIMEMTYTLHIDVISVDEPPVFNRFVVTQNGLEVSPTLMSGGKRYTLKDSTQYDDISVRIVSDNLGDDVSYQWMQGATTSQRVPVGDNTDTLTIDTSTTNAMQHYYVCIVTSKGVSYTSPIFFITRVQVLSLTPPIIVKQPGGSEYSIGDKIERLSVTIESALYGHYQWYNCSDETGADSAQIEGATLSYFFPDITVSGSYWYYCEIWYEKETVISDRTRSDIVEIRVVNNAPWQGDGSSENPFVLSKESDLVALREAVASGSSFAGMYFCFANNIALSDSWVPIGTLKEGATSTGQGTNILPFSGTIDGCGYTIEVAPDGKPLFNYVRGATVQNLNIYGERIAGYGLVDCYTVDYGADGDYWNTGVPETISIDNCHILSGTQIMYSGFLGGYASGLNIVRITNCTVAEGVIIGYGMTAVMPDGNSTSVGSMAGDFNGYVTNCTSAATVMGQNTVGGLIGAKGQSMGPCNVTGSSFTGTITSNGNAGGIIGAGYNSSNSPCVVIENCTVSGTITGSGSVGGILGREGNIVQAWDNGIGGIRNNRFTGTINASGQNVGGIVGYICSLNMCNVIENNYYAPNCGAERGIGFVKYVDTSCPTHETTSGAIYFDTSVALPGITGVDRMNHNRTDDPLGADKEKLCYSQEKTEAYVTDFILSGNYKTEYLVGDTFDSTGMEFTAKWSDGREPTHPTAEEVTFTGFDSSEPGTKLITVKYGDSSTTFSITIKPKSQKITVTITVLGDYVHDSDADGICHGGNKLGGLQTWVAATECEADTNETVWAVLQRLAADKGLSIRNPSGNYIEAINGLGEFTNGRNSGWLYTLNGHYPNLGVNEQYLHDGDVIVLHYTDDYVKDGVDMGGNPNQDAQAISAVEKLIDAIGTPVTLDSKAKIEAAREAYDKLTYAQQMKVQNAAKLTAAEEELKKLQAAADKEAANRVIALIDSMNLQDEYTVVAARAAYDALTDAQKALVTNYDKLIQAEEKLEEERASPEDIRAANAVTIKIKTLPNPVTLADEAAIKEAREAYEKLTDVQKRLVKSIDRLVEAENQLAQLKATDADRQIAEQVKKQIEALNDPVTLDDEAAIKEARLAYDALTETQKGLVTNEKKLTDAERDLALLKATAEDKAAAKAVEAKIAALPSPVTLDDEKAIQEARKAYDELTETQKALVSNIEALKNAEHQLAELKATDEDKTAAAEVEKLIEELNLPVSLDDEAAIKAAREAYDKLTDVQKALVTNLGRLVKAETDLEKLQQDSKDRDIYKITGDFMEDDYLGELDSPVVGSIGGEWLVIGLARSGREVPGGDGYYNNAVEYVRENINDNEQLHWARSTDNSRMILALTALGYDPTDVDGHDLLMGLTDMEYIEKQGINGPIWALIAFDSNQYEIPENPNAADQVTREKIINYLLGEQLADGGWSLSGDISDPDITGMTIQALAPYYKTNEAVRKAVDEALETISRMQNVDGTFTSSMSGGEPSSESVAQILVALSALGIDPEKDARFIKNGNTILDALAKFFVEGGGFSHTLGGQRDGMATEQVYYALTAYFRMRDGMTSLYDMTDVAVPLAAPEVTATPEPTAAPEEPEEEVALAVDAAEGEDEKKGVSAVWIAPPVGIAGIVAYLLDRKRRKAKG